MAGLANRQPDTFLAFLTVVAKYDIIPLILGDTDMQKIDKRRLPDITIRETGETYYGRDGEKTPLEQVLEASEEKSIFLVGNGGQGKSTTLFSYWVDHICDGNCLYVNLRMLNPADKENAIEKYLLRNYHLNIHALKECLLLLDGINEAPEGLLTKPENDDIDFQPYLYREIFTIESNLKVVISARNDLDIVNISRYKKCILNELRDEQTSENFADKKMQQLVRNNQILSMYRDLKNSEHDLFQIGYKNAGQLIEDWFENFLRIKFIQRFLQGRYDLTENEIKKLLERNSIPFYIREAKNKWEKFINLLIWEGHFLVRGKPRYLRLWLPEFLIDYDEFREMSAYLGIIHIETIERDIVLLTWTDDFFGEYFRVKKILLKMMTGNSKISNDDEWFVNQERDRDFTSIDDLFDEQPHYDDYESLEPNYESDEVCWLLGNFLELKPKVLDEYCSWGGTKIFNRRDLDGNILKAIILNKQIADFSIDNSYFTIIYESLFSFSQTLHDVSLSQDIERIGEGAFSGCTNLKNVKLPENGLKSIGAAAFMECMSIEAIWIPKSVKDMGSNVFCGCWFLKDIYCEHKCQPDEWNKNWLGDKEMSFIWELMLDYEKSNQGREKEIQLMRKHIACRATIHWGTTKEQYESIVKNCG